MVVAYFRENNAIGNAETLVQHPAGKIEIVRLNESGRENPDVFGHMTIEGAGAKNQMTEKLVTYQNYRSMIKNLVEESFVPQDEMEILLEAFLEMAYDFVEELVYLTYESEIIEPERRRGLFQNLAEKARESGRLGESELEMLAEYEADMMPQERIINGYLQMGMELPGAYKITLGDVGRAKEGTEPTYNILYLQIQYCNLHFPEAFDRNVERGFSLNEVQALKDLIRQEKQLDTLAKIYFNQFIEKVERRYK